MAIDLSSPYVIAGTTIVVLAFLFLIEPVVSRRRLNGWCDTERYRLVSWRGARFYEGPRRWLRTEDDYTYYVEVLDRSGKQKKGYVNFDNRFWPFRLGRVVTEWESE